MEQEHTNLPSMENEAGGFNLPNPITGQGIGTGELPYDIFSDKAKEFVEHCSYMFNNCPKDFIVAGMVTAVGVALGKWARLDYDMYKDYGNLYVALVGNSTVGKSSPLKQCLKPLLSIDKKLLADSQAERARIKAEGGKKDTGQPLPPEKQFIIKDCTPEKRNEMLNSIDGTPLMPCTYFDELNSIFKQFGRYNNNSEMEDLLTMFDGGIIKVSRKSADTMLIENALLSIIGTVQDDIDILKDSFANKTMLKSGFNPRWLFVFPDEEPLQHVDKKIKRPEVFEWWDSFIHGIYSRIWQGKPYVLHMDEDAEQLYIDYINAKRDEINQLAKDERGRYLMWVLGKLDIHCLKWALASHFLSKYPDRGCINLADIDYSIRAMGYFRRTQMKIYDILAGNSTKKQQWLNEWIHRTDKSETKQQFAKRKGVSDKYVYKITQGF